jgi:small subunit ribosomal protein S4
MGRHTGPVERLSRREGVDLELKGARRLAGKGALDRRGAAAPGEHGARSGRRPSVYARQLREKQRAKRFYGVRERQFRRYVDLARRSASDTGGALLNFLELRLDNVVYRLGLASTRAQARQFITHGHVLVDGRRTTIPSRILQPGATVALRVDSGARAQAEAATELVALIPPWLQADHDALSGQVLRAPVREEIQVPVDERLIVEHYARA